MSIAWLWYAAGKESPRVEFLTRRYVMEGVKQGGLVLSRKPGESVSLGECIRVEVVDVKGGRVKLRVVAPDDVRILRSGLKPRKDAA